MIQQFEVWFYWFTGSEPQFRENNCGTNFRNSLPTIKWVDMIRYSKYSLSNQYFFFEYKPALHIFMSTQSQLLFFFGLKNLFLVWFWVTNPQQYWHCSKSNISISLFVVPLQNSMPTTFWCSSQKLFWKTKFSFSFNQKSAILFVSGQTDFIIINKMIS